MKVARRRIKPNSKPILGGTATESDAEGLLRLLNRLDGEFPFTMYEPGERTTTVEAQRGSLRASLAGLDIYEKAGLAAEGSRKDSTLVTGSYVDRRSMAKLLN